MRLFQAAEDADLKELGVEEENLRAEVAERERRVHALALQFNEKNEHLLRTRRAKKEEEEAALRAMRSSEFAEQVKARRAVGPFSPLSLPLFPLMIYYVVPLSALSVFHQI